MIDFDDVMYYVRMYYRVAIGIVILVALYLAIWLFKGYGGREEVKATIDEIKTTTEVHERRADDIIDAAKAKEVAASNEVKKAVDTTSDDALPDILAGLLADYRKQQR